MDRVQKSEEFVVTGSKQDKRESIDMNLRSIHSLLRNESLEFPVLAHK